MAIRDHPILIGLCQLSLALQNASIDDDGIDIMRLRRTHDRHHRIAQGRHIEIGRAQPG